jgi:hypothetical protein
VSLYFGVRLAAKAGESPHDCQDAWWVNPAEMRVAVSDGAARSLFPREWAWLLVRAFCGGENGAARLPTTAAEWQRWLDGPRRQWLGQVRERIERSPNRLLLHNRLVQRHPAAATLAGLVLTPTLQEVRWESTTLGDTCILHFFGRTVVSHPVSQSVQFDSHPLALLSVSDPSRERVPSVRYGVAAPGDLLVLATDALAKYLLVQHEGGRDVRRMVLEWMADENDALFESRLARARDYRAAGGGVSPLYLEDDDITLMVISVGDRQPGLHPLEQAVPPPIPTASPDLAGEVAVARHEVGGFSDDWLATRPGADLLGGQTAEVPATLPAIHSHFAAAAVRDEWTEIQGSLRTPPTAHSEKTDSVADGGQGEFESAGAHGDHARLIWPRSRWGAFMRVWLRRLAWRWLLRFTYKRVLVALGLSLASNVYLLEQAREQDQEQPRVRSRADHADNDPVQDTDLERPSNPPRLVPGTMLFSAPGEKTGIFKVGNDSLAAHPRSVKNGWAEITLEGWVARADSLGKDSVEITTAVRLREDPSTSLGRSLGTLQPGARLEKLGERDKWYHVRLRSFVRL